MVSLTYLKEKLWTKNCTNHFNHIEAQQALSPTFLLRNVKIGLMRGDVRKRFNRFDVSRGFPGHEL